MAELTLEQRRALAVATARKRLHDQKATAPPASPAADPNRVVRSGMILPISREADGGVRFDSDAGIVGAIKRAVTLPGQAMRGEVPVRGDDGRITDEVIGRAAEMAAVTSPSNPGIRAGDRVIPGRSMARQRPDVRPPSAKQLLQTGSDQFDAMRATGARYSAADVKRMAETAMVRLNAEGYDDITAPRTFQSLRRLATPGEDEFVDIANLHSARRAFGKHAQNFNDPADQGAALRVMDAIDGFIARPDPNVSGPQARTGSSLSTELRTGGGLAGGANGDRARLAASLLDRANANWSAGRRSDSLLGIERAADLRAAAANSGQNTGNAIRQRVASALLKQKDIAGFSPAEKDALERIVRGTRGQNMTRRVGNFLGGGQGLGGMTAMGMGGAAGAGIGMSVGAPGAGGIIGAMAPVAIGAGLKGASNRMTQKALGAADAMVRSRSPLYEEMLRQTPMEAASPTRRASIMRIINAMMLSQPQAAQSGGGAGF